VETPLKVDGILDEDVWRQALVIPADIEVEPGENVPAPVKTEVLLACGPKHFYIAFKAHDPDPSKIRARYTDRDKMWDDDWVAVVLDTFNDGRRAFDFGCNPLGVQGDSVETTGGGESGAWDAIWDSAGRITPDGYIVEMAIPYSSLRFQESGENQIWGFDAVRSYPRGVRHHIGSYPRDRGNNCYLCQALKISGFAGADPGRNLEFDPTLAATYAQTRDGFPDGPFIQRDSRVDPGITVRWSPTPNTALNATVNPDFSQVEADAVQLNINKRFALFYPEKRPFFMEGADYFDTPIPIVYTRTLADPSWGVKGTGKLGRGTVGAFAVQDTVTNLVIPGSLYSQETQLPGGSLGSVLRYRLDLGTSSTLGFMATSREGREYSNRVFGVDAALRFSKEDVLYLNAYGSRTKYPRTTAEGFGQRKGAFDGGAFDVMYQHETRNWETYVHYLEYGTGFRADLGYVPQVGYSFFDVGVLRTWYSGDAGHWFNEIKVWWGYELTRDSQRERQREVYGSFVEYQGPKQSHLFATLYIGKLGYAGKPFDGNTFSASGNFFPTGNLQLGLGLFYGDDIDYSGIRQARRYRLSPWLLWFCGRHFRLTLNHYFERLWVEEGRLYRAHLSEARAVYQFTARAFLRVILQRADYRFAPALYPYPVDPTYRDLTSQILYSYKINPQTALYIGYSDTYLGDPRKGLVQTDRALFVKVGYAWVR
jgi:hypothetical protein